MSQTLKLYFHPLSSFSMKALVAFYENGTPFTPRSLSEDGVHAEMMALWPIGKFPVLRDEARGATVPEATMVIEYLAQFYPGPVRFVPADPDLAWQTRLSDRFFDLYVNRELQNIVDQLLRAPEKRDADATVAAEKKLPIAYDILEARLADKTWAVGADFTLADCAAAPALYYANALVPLDAQRPHASAYLERLLTRPSFARAVKESQPYTNMLPFLDRYKATYGERFSQ